MGSNYTLGAGPAYGGSIYAGGLTSLTVRACAFSQGYAQSGGNNALGGALYLAVANAAVTDCRIQGMGTTNDYVGDTCIASGTVVMTNNLIADNNGNGITAAGGTLSVINCTLAGNAGWGITNGSATLAVTNSIVWANMLGGIKSNVTTSIAYSDVQEGAPPGVGNISQDPLFVDAVDGDYHVMSLAGSWHGGVWENDRQMSPCIDAGEPAPGSAYNLEPKPNGGRVNMGSYGNTPEASLTSRGTVIRIW